MEIKREGDISPHRWRYLCDIVPYSLVIFPSYKASNVSLHSRP
jgi:hypothetical protein